jgi:TPR repeat protein
MVSDVDLDMIGQSIDVCIFGCCVSGNSIRLSKPNEFNIKKFVQYFSPISMFDKVEERNHVSNQECNFGNFSTGHWSTGHWMRSCTSALNGTIPETLVASGAGWIIIDNYCACFPSVKIVYPDKTVRKVQSNEPRSIMKIINNSEKLTGSVCELIEELPDMDAWVPDFVDFLKKNYGNRIILIGVREAKYRIDDDNNIESTVDTNVSKYISKIDKRILDELDCHYIEIPNNVIAVDHVNPVHYIYEAYQYVVTSLRLIIKYNYTNSEIALIKEKYEKLFDSILKKKTAPLNIIRKKLSSGQKDYLKQLDGNITPDAYRYKSQLYRKGTIVKKDAKKSLEYIKLAMANGNMSYASDYFRALCVQDWQSSNDFYVIINKLAEHGLPDAMEYLGRLYRDGKYVEKDLQKAIFWFKKAYGCGMTWAGIEASDILIKSSDVEDVREGLSILENESNKGDGTAMSRLGWAYNLGVGVEKNIDKAKKWLYKSYLTGNKWSGEKYNEIVNLSDKKTNFVSKNKSCSVIQNEMTEHAFDRITSISKKHGIYAIICGAIRYEFELKMILIKLTSLVNAGIIDGIVLSTWKNEIDKIENLRVILDNLNITVVESDPVDDSLSSFIYINNARQSIQLNAALNVLPKDCFVLKCRSDLSLGYIDRILETVQNVSFEIKERNRFNIDFNYKICLLTIGLSAPFHSTDIVFFGYADDIRKLILLESKRFLNRDLPADCIFFLAPFIHRFSIISDYLKLMKYWDINQMIKDMPSIENLSALPSVIIKFFSQYFSIIESCFSLYDSNFDESSEVSLDDLFIKKDSKHTTRGWIKNITDSRVLKKIISGDVKKTRLYDMFQPYIDINKDDNLALLISINQHDVEEFRQFILTQYGSRFLVNSNAVVEKDNCSYDIDFVSKEIFSNYSEYEDDYIKLLNFTTKLQSTNNNYYRDLKLLLSELDDTDSPMYDALLVTILKLLTNNGFRKEDDVILLEAAKRLHKGEIKKEMQASVESVFIKYGFNKNTLLTMPASKERLCANYYFAKYCENKGIDYSKKLMSTLSGYCKVTIVSEDIDSYLLKLNEELSASKVKDDELHSFVKAFVQVRNNTPDR